MVPHQGTSSGRIYTARIREISQVRPSRRTVDLVEHALGDPEGGVGVRYTAVHGGLQQDFFDFLPRQPVPERGGDVQRKLLVVPARDQRRQRDHRTTTTVQAGTRPDCAPGEFGDEGLEIASEFGAPRTRLLDVALAEHFPTHGLAPLVARVAHLAPGLLSFANTSAIRSGRSAGARWAARVTSTKRPRVTLLAM